MAENTLITLIPFQGNIVLDYDANTDIKFRFLYDARMKHGTAGTHSLLTIISAFTNNDDDGLPTEADSTITTVSTLTGRTPDDILVPDSTFFEAYDHEVFSVPYLSTIGLTLGTVTADPEVRLYSCSFMRAAPSTLPATDWKHNLSLTSIQVNFLSGEPTP